jgi:hypothetical protein
VGDLKIPPQLQFQITKHLNLAFSDLKLEKFVGDLDLGLLKWIRTPNVWETLKFLRGSNFKSPNI